MEAEGWGGGGGWREVEWGGEGRGGGGGTVHFGSVLPNMHGSVRDGIGLVRYCCKVLLKRP